MKPAPLTAMTYAEARDLPADGPFSFFDGETRVTQFSFTQGRQTFAANCVEADGSCSYKVRVYA